MPMQVCKKPSCKFRHPPVCQNYKSEKGCIHGQKCFFRHVEAEEKPNKRSKKGGAKGSVAILKECTQLVVNLEILIRENLFYVKRECWDRHTHRQILQRHLAPSSNSGKKGSIARYSPKVSVVLARQNSGTDLEPRKMRPQSSVGFGKTYLQAQEFGQSFFVYSCWSKGNAGTHFEKTRGARIFCEDPGNPTVELAANEEVHTNEEAQVYVHNLNLFVTVQLLEETPAVLSLGKLCEDHGYSYGWVSGQKPRLTKEGKIIICKTDNFVPLVVPGLSTNSGSFSSSTSPPQDLLREEAERASRKLVRPASSSSSSPVLERSGGIAPGNWFDPSKNPTKIKRGMMGEIRTTVCKIFH